MRSRDHAAAFLLVYGVLVSAGCGFATSPRPPEFTKPDMPGPPEVRVLSTGDYRISWARPKQSMDGEALNDLAGFHVERWHTGAPAFERIATIEVNDQDRIRRSGRFLYVDNDVPVGGAWYRISAFTRDGQTARTAPASIEATPESSGATANDSSP